MVSKATRASRNACAFSLNNKVPLGEMRANSYCPRSWLVLHCRRTQ